MTVTSTSLLQTALQNLHVSQQANNQSHTPRDDGSQSRDERDPTPGSPQKWSMRSISSEDGESDDGDGDDLVKVGQGTRPATPLPGQKGLVLGQRVSSALSGKNPKDPVSTTWGEPREDIIDSMQLRVLPTHLAVRVFLQLDVKSLARCNRVCKRWNKSSTLNYGESSTNTKCRG